MIPFFMDPIPCLKKICLKLLELLLKERVVSMAKVQSLALGLSLFTVSLAMLFSACL
jgi:hypothetical protein